MTLPRWLLIGMIWAAILLPLVAAAWWWVTWPERTAEQFVALAAAGRWDEANRMIQVVGDAPRVARLHGDSWRRYFTNRALQMDGPSTADLLLARRTFHATGGVDFYVTRSHIEVRLLIEGDDAWARGFGP